MNSDVSIHDDMNDQSSLDTVELDSSAEEEDLAVSDETASDTQDEAQSDLRDLAHRDTPEETDQATEDTLPGDSGAEDGDVADSATVDAIVEVTPDSAEPDSAGDTGETDLPPIPTFDCATITNDVVEVTVVSGARADRGLTFSQSGEHLIGVLQPNVIQAEYGEPLSVLSPGVGGMEQIDLLPDGDYVVSRPDNDTLTRISQEGSTTVIATDIQTYVVRVGPDGMVYVTNGEEGPSSRIYRIDPDTGEEEIWLRGNESTPYIEPRVFDFSPDFTRFYIGNHEYNGGTIYVVDLDEDYNPLGPAEVFAEDVGDWHDGLGVDICGYLYVASYNDQDTYRISPDGTEVIKILNASFSDGMYGHGIAWGSGVGGWLEDALYIPQPNNGNTVGEARIGVPYRTWEGVVLNRP
jgi:hypothetical protein